MRTMRALLLPSVLAASCAAFSLRAAPPPVAPMVIARVHAVALMQAEGEAEEPSVELPPVEPPAEVVDAMEPPSEVVDAFVSDVEDAAPVDEVSMLKGSIAKEALKAEIADGMAGPRPDKAVVGEILLALEAQNPTRSPATSPLLNGKWKFLYASGASPGLKALMLLLRGAKAAPKSPSGAEVVDVQDTYLTIGAEQPRATAEVQVRVLSFENTIKLSSRLDAESAVRLVETYDAAESEYMSLRLPFQSPVQYKRSVLISYLDDEMMVVRDALGRPDVLMRCGADSGTAWAPSSLDGDVTNDADDAPGAS